MNQWPSGRVLDVHLLSCSAEVPAARQEPKPDLDSSPADRTHQHGTTAGCVSVPHWHSCCWELVVPGWLARRKKQKLLIFLYLHWNKETADFQLQFKWQNSSFPPLLLSFISFISFYPSVFPYQSHTCVLADWRWGGGMAPLRVFLPAGHSYGWLHSKSEPAGRPAVKSSGSNVLLALHTGDSRPPQWPHHRGHNICWFCWYPTKYQWSWGVLFTWTWGRCCWRPWCSSGVSPKLEPFVFEKQRCSSFISE